MTWLQELAELTGEEIYNLAGMFDHWEVLVAQAGRKPRLPAARVQELNRMMLELIELRADVLIQVARIRVPMREASQIIDRARYARRQPVPVHGGG